MAYKQPQDNGLQELKMALRDKNPGRLYFFYGEEVFLLHHYLDQLKKKTVDELTESFNYHKLNSETFDIQSFADAVENLPMMAERTMVQVDDVDVFKLSENDRNHMAEILSDIPDYCTVVFTYITVEFKPDKRLNLWKILENNGQIIEFAQSSAASLIPWIKRHFYELGKTIDTPECEYLLFLCGASMENLLTEIAKIAAGTPQERIDRGDIDALGSRVLEATVFELTDSLLEREYSKGLMILRDLFDMKQEPVAILAAVTKQMQRLYGAKLAAAKGKSENEIAQVLGFKSAYPARRLIQSARRCSIGYLRQVQQACLEADLALKSNLPDPQRTVELLLLRFAEAAK